MLSRLSVADRARLTTGADLWSTHAESRLGLPALRTSDGPNGVRGSRFDERVRAWCTPCGSGIAATWDEDLVCRVGELLGDEARRMDIDVLLGPTMNLHRSPLGGRGFECFSEDPLLSGRIAAAWVAGVQSRGVAATAKHFVGNDSETHRTRVDCIIDERALRELYLVPFEYAVAAGVWAVMASYNRVNGIHVSQHTGLLDGLLRREWGFDGLVVSDWGAARDTVASARAGLDLEMPAGRVFGAALAAAVEAGQVPEAVLDDKVERLRRTAQRVRDHPSRRLSATGPAVQDLARAQEALLTEAAAASFVLLKNDAGLLPLKVEPGRGPLAVLGPNAADPCFQGGGSAWVNAGTLRTPLAALQDAYAGTVEVNHETGCVARRSFLPLELLDTRAAGPGSERGMTVSYDRAGTGPPQPVTELRRSSTLSWHDGIEVLAGRPGVVSMSTWLTPSTTGDHHFSVKGSGATTISVDGRLVGALDGQADEDDVYAALFSPALATGVVSLAADVPVRIEARMQHEPVGIPVLEVGCRPPEPADLLPRAVEAAGRAQAVVLVVGTSTDDEAESIDRRTTSLPGDQDALVEAVLDANPRTVVVVNAGVAVDMPWAARASTILYTWLPGTGFADALAAVLAGRMEPGGRLPVTLAANPEQYPAYDTTPDPGERLVYRESVFVGYRHFQAEQLAPAFPFGHGLGYTRFHLGPLENLSDSPGADIVTIGLPVTNVGERAGKEVVQLYVGPGPSDQRRPPWELKDFRSVHLEPGATKQLRFSLGTRAFAHWDPARHRWSAVAGPYQICVGRSVGDLSRSLTIDYPGSGKPTD